MTAPQVLNTERIGQLTGSTGEGWPALVDPQGLPLLTDTGRWGVVGVDLGANTEHNGRLYFFFGDVATRQRPGDPPLNSDLVAWTDERTILRHGGHQAIGLEFVLPFEPASIQGQRQWRFCLKCAGLFFDDDPAFKGVCPAGGGHDTFGLGEVFVMPFEPTAIAGQHDWRFCGQCASLFFEDPAHPAPCPAGGVHSAIGSRFVVPLASEGVVAGQSAWRFCANCHSLFWDGDAFKGVCVGAAGGGFHLQAALREDGQFAPFQMPPPINTIDSLETPNGAFSHDGRAYVFAGFAEERWSGVRRDGDPTPGHYLFSKADPSAPGLYDTEFMLSPKLGWCATDAARTSFVSHNARGLSFVLPHDLSPSDAREQHWRSCAKCEALFFDGDPSFQGVCQRGGAHLADPAQPEDYALERGLAGDSQNQADWFGCGKCLALYFGGDASDTGLCPASGRHEPTGANLRVPHRSMLEDATQQPSWRFCTQCFTLFFDAHGERGVCAKTSGPHTPAGFEFVLPHDVPAGADSQSGWRFCLSCSGLFFDGSGDKGICPASGAGHVPAGHEFVLPHTRPETFDRQVSWRFCTKCVGLFFDGLAEKGRCPRDGLGHSAAGLDFALAHQPGEDATNRGHWRFCLACHGMVRSDQTTWFPWVAPVVVNNADHVAIDSDEGQGVVMVGFDWTDFRLLWMPLPSDGPPRFDSLRYFHAGRRQWLESPDKTDGTGLFSHPLAPSYTHVSLSWRQDAGWWVLLYATAWDEKRTFDAPAVARFSRDLIEWTEPAPIFDPAREDAYRRYFHDPGHDTIHPDVPPAQRPGKDNPGWAYGVFLLDRFTTCDAASSTMNLVYLLSPGSPYQVQLMSTTVQLA